MAAAVSTARALVESRLAEEGTTVVEFARRRGLAHEVVHRVVQGEYPPDPPQLRALGRALGAEPEAWAELVAAGLARRAPADAARSLPGRLWSHLVLHGLSIDAFAERMRTTPRVVKMALASGVVSKRLRDSGIPQAIGCGLDEPELGDRATAVNPELQAMLAAAFAARPSWSTKSFALRVGLAPASVRSLRQGMVPYRLNPIVVPRLASDLGLALETFAHQLALSYRTASSNAGTVKHLLMRHCFRHGLTLEAVARRIGLTPRTLVDLTADETARPETRTLDALHRELRVPEHEWRAAVQRHPARLMVDSGTYRSLVASTRPLHVLVRQAAQQAGDGDPVAWALRHGLTRAQVLRIVEHGQPPGREDTRACLVRALRIDRTTFDIACRLMTEAPPRPPRGSSPEDIVPRNGLQENLLRLIVQQGLRVRDIERQVGLSRKTIEKIAYLGATNLTDAVKAKLMAVIGVRDPVTFDALLTPFDSPDLVDDEELRAVALLRRMQPASRPKWLEFGGRMLADPAAAQLTLTYRR